MGMTPFSSDRDGRPLMFLVSTTPCSRAIGENLGESAYSYHFVLEALAPALERLGRWQAVPRPESSLPVLAERAEAEGFRPIHLVLNPPQDAYFSPSVPNVLFPFWEFPEVPNRDFGHDVRQNWVRSCRAADLILCACEFTAEAFRKAGVSCPVEVVPVPIPSRAFDVAPWDPAHEVTIVGRHEVVGRWADSESRREAPNPAVPTPKPRSPARAAFERLSTRLDPHTVASIYRFKQKVAGQSPRRLAYMAVRATYNRTLRRVLSDEAVSQITLWKNAALRPFGFSPKAVIDPLLPSGPLTLSGLVYTSLMNPSDSRKNMRDLLSAFLLAFRDRPDVTLVLKLACSPRREYPERKRLRDLHASLGIEHRCRVVALTDFLDEDQMDDLIRASTYYVNTSHAEGACLPLQRALASGRPAIAPDHSAMADYMNPHVGHVIGSSLEPAPWPHDPELRLETHRYRLRWSSLLSAFEKSGQIAREAPETYARQSRHAREQLREFASVEVVADRLAQALQRLDSRPMPRLARAS